MIEELTDSKQGEANIVALVSTALRQDRLAGLSEMLRTIAEAADAYGCVLWQVTPGSNLSADSPTGNLFVLAQWLQDNNQLALLYDLPLQSVTGQAVLTQRAVNVPDIRSEPLNILTSFQEDAGIETMCAVPVTFLDGMKGTLNLYRNVPQPFTLSEIRTVEQLASLVPALYQTIMDKVSLRLISTIDRIVNDAELRSRDLPLSLTDMKEVFRLICGQIAATFHCVEASLFLQANLEMPGRYELIATTWPGRFKKPFYRASAREGLTGWVFERGEPIKIFDLANFERDTKVIRKDYPNLTWRDSLNIKGTAREFLGLADNVDLPPLSFMAAPIVIGDNVLGAIRCCTVKEGPYYFADRELDLLMLAAAQVGRYASNWLGRREMHQENDSWRALVRSVSRLNRFVQNELTREVPNELRIFEEALRLTSSVIAGAEIMDVRLIDDRTKELYFATTHGKAWNEGSELEIDERKRRRFSVRGEPKSAGAYVIKTGQLYVVTDATTDPFYSKTFPFIKRMIIAPISVERERFGVLDIRATSGSEFPKHAEAIAELLGQQLGLYHFLARNIGRLRKAEVDLKTNIGELERMRDQQAQTFEDLEHQLRSPIIQAYARIQSLLIEAQHDARLRPHLQAISGLCGKARRVASSAGLFARLARQEPIEPSKRRLEHDNLVKMLIEAAADHELLTDPARGITFHIHRKSYDLLRMFSVEVDNDLLEQAISNLLDNAGKYSSKRTRVDISWGVTGGERFQITVVNKGLAIHSSDVRRCRERGWRGSIAAAVTGEGSGIGLWIVDNIMAAHNGELIIVPTTADGSTEVKLVFPASKG